MQFLNTHFPVTCHTRHVGPGSTFVAIRGYKEDGIAYIPQALELGATTIVVQQDSCLSAHLISRIDQHKASLVHVENVRKALAALSAQVHGFPAAKLKIIGITGTKGKTSTAFILEHILRTAGHKTALLGTVKNSINGIDMPHVLTTPQPDYLHAFLKSCVDAGVSYVVMEVAAQALSLHRVEGISFDGVIFTNFSIEHGEFYQRQEDYLAAKKSIFKQLKLGAPCFVNQNDEQGKTILQEYPQFGSYGNSSFECPALIGHFNSYNISGAVHMARALGVASQIIQDSLMTFKGVPGRMERHDLPNGAMAVIDYAHNPSSFEAILPTLRSLTDTLIVVFGCGGERDASKRPIMGAIAAKYADKIVITSDNPRSEYPETISRDIYGGIPDTDCHKVIVELDRATAIRRAYAYTKEGSIVALLGKGPDEYQEIQGIKYPFSEKVILATMVG